MSPSRCACARTATALLALALVARTEAAPLAYLSHLDGEVVTVIDTGIAAVVGTLPVDPLGFGTAVSPDWSRVYVLHFEGSVSVIETSASGPDLGSMSPPLDVRVTRDAVIDHSVALTACAPLPGGIRCRR